jgi:hypothetical protein
MPNGPRCLLPRPGGSSPAGDDNHGPVLLREGHFWGRKEVAIPVSAVASLDDGIWFNLAKKQVEELPPRA